MKNKIEAKHVTINELLRARKFYIDYFQREYRWQTKHITLLIEDLTTTFLKSYSENGRREDVAQYLNYYLGSVIFFVNPEDQKRSIVDGQQRITSLTLLLIYLNHLQTNNSQGKVSVNELIFSEKYGNKSLNMTDKFRATCLTALFDQGTYEPRDDDDETICNMVERYEDIAQSFPEELHTKALPFFIDWLTENVIIVEITAYSDENAYTIFETMNDRGLNLTPTEMLKGYILSKITDPAQRVEINEIWRSEVQKLHSYDETADQAFFQAWFRGKYAESIRPGKAGSENQDFDLIGSRFHSWFKDNHKERFSLKTSDDFYNYCKNQFPFYVKWYLEGRQAQAEYKKDMPHLHYIGNWGIAESLQDPLLLSSIVFNEQADIIKNKLDYTARYIETFTVRRSINFKKFSQASIKYTMFNLVKSIRDNQLTELTKNLSREIDNIPQKWNGIDDFKLHGQNKKFVKHLLSRISGYLDELVGKDSNYVSYHHPKSKQFQIEHIWEDEFTDYGDEFDQENEFQEWRNSIGALILLPEGTNQSFSNKRYAEKINHYRRENTYAQTLHPDFYQMNPNFLNSSLVKNLQFQPHARFKKQDIKERKKLVERICEQLWSTDYFSNN